MNKTLIALSAFALLSLSMSGVVNADAGEDAYNANCASCHGAKGASPIIPTYPKLQGQNAAYTYKQIKAFQDGSRVDPSMNALSGLIAGNEQAVADYLAAQ